MVKQVDTKEFNELIAQDKVVFADFFATWCGPCKMLAPKVEAISAMPEYADRVVFVKIDVDEEEELAESFGIMNIPTMMIFKNGEAVKTQIGGADVAILTAMIDEVL
ncbi:MAG: thioredoxin [Lachnospiraceae bacterium]|nr:thioredoxin [Lachnospiraceae bacterium]